MPFSSDQRPTREEYIQFIQEAKTKCEDCSSRNIVEEKKLFEILVDKINEFSTSKDFDFKKDRILVLGAIHALIHEHYSKQK